MNAQQALDSADMPHRLKFIIFIKTDGKMPLYPRWSHKWAQATRGKLDLYPINRAHRYHGGDALIVFKHLIGGYFKVKNNLTGHHSEYT